MQTKPTPWRRPEPWPGSVHTERLVLRWYETEDAGPLYEAVSSDREALLPWLPWAQTGHSSVAEAVETIERFTRLRTEGADFTIGAFDRETGAVVGGTGFHRLVPDAHEAETGYWICGARQREGLCTEMTRAWISAGFRDWGFRRIILRCAGGNVGSRGVIEGIGIPAEACEREARWIDGAGWDDQLVFGVLEREWDCENQRMR